ncbi:hypothetical protein ACP6PU_002775 [Cronobacter dublinensis]|nr:hypothetical protein [Cronobacter dublinensis]
MLKLQRQPNILNFVFRFATFLKTARQPAAMFTPYSQSGLLGRYLQKIAATGQILMIAIILRLCSRQKIIIWREKPAIAAGLTLFGPERPAFLKIKR